MEARVNVSDAALGLFIDSVVCVCSMLLSHIFVIEQIRTGRAAQYTVVLGYNVMKWPEYFASL
jgi:hypothetical protein